MLLFKKISFYLALVGIGFAVHVAISSQLKDPLPPLPSPAPEKPVKRVIAASGLVEARHENVAVGVPVAGLVVEVPVKVWEGVVVGQPLLRLDDRDLRALLLVQEAQVEVARAMRLRSESQWNRRRLLGEAVPRAISVDELETRTNEVAIARAQEAAAEAAVAQTRLLLDRLVVRAPRTGTILQVNIRSGEYAVPGAARPPLLLGETDELQIRADVDENLAPRVRPDRPAHGYVKGDAAHPVPLRFVRIEPYVVPKVSLTGGSSERVDTRVLQLIYAFSNRVDRPVYVGQQMDVYIEE